MMTRMTLVWGFLAGLALLSAGCGKGEAARGKYPLRVVCTTGMVGDLVRRVGGEFVSVSLLMGEGVDPHLYKPSPGDIQALSDADLIFYSGCHLEGKMGEVFASMARRKPTLGIADAIDPNDLLSGEGGFHDPHLWFDVSLWSRTLEPIREALTKYDPAHAETYQANAKAYRDELTELDGWARTELARIPKAQRVLVTAHDAFRYFGRAYDVEVRGIQGISTESEAGVGAINALVGFLKERRIKAVFVESSVSQKNIQALIEGCAVPPDALKLKIGGELFSDAMGKPDTPEGTYPGMVRHNVRLIVEALR
jgi:manganese/zinc/iron transport system substrate-binding protein